MIFFLIKNNYLTVCGVLAASCRVLLRFVDSLVVAHGLSSCVAWTPEHTRASVLAACGLSCSVTCGILVPKPGIKRQPLHCKVDS